MILNPITSIWRNSPKLSLVLIIAPLFISCATRQSIYPVGVIPPAKNPTPSEEKYGQQVLQELTQKTPLDYSNSRMGEVQQVVDRLAKAANATSSPWQVYLLKDPNTKNAAATRGNHLFVWSGMLDFAKNEDELASILGHEMSHVLAGHTGPDRTEEIKQALISLGALAAGTAASIVVPQAGSIVGQLASDSTTQLGNAAVIYPNSRSRELEADRIGIFLMADAGYNPASAVALWTRAQTDPAFRSIPFLSTHPGAEDRLVQLKALLPQAEARYRAYGKAPLPNATIPPATEVVVDPNQQNFVAADQATTLSTPPLTNRVKNCVTSWTVTADKAIVYSKSDRGSKALGELQRGAAVCAMSNRGGWIKIYDPDTGYINSADLSQ